MTDDEAWSREPRNAAAPARVVEIRSYALKPGSRDAFHGLMAGQALPMLREWRIDVLAHGSSPHDPSGYFLIRSWRDLAERQSSQDAFYGSDAWRNGPREPMLALIVAYLDTVLPLDDAAIAALRRSLAG